MAKSINEWLETLSELHLKCSVYTEICFTPLSICLSTVLENLSFSTTFLHWFPCDNKSTSLAFKNTCLAHIRRNSKEIDGRSVCLIKMITTWLSHNKNYLLYCCINICINIIDSWLILICSIFSFCFCNIFARKKI